VLRRDYKMHAGDIVTIDNGGEIEGRAKLIVHSDIDNGGLNDGYEWWLVEFQDEKGEYFDRIVEFQEGKGEIIKV
jgi:hypothetical protein